MARNILADLRSAGVRYSDITVISSIPVEFAKELAHDGTSRMTWIATVGAIVGACAGFGLAGYTQQNYPIPTGGMPIVPLWTDGILAYELMMLGAIVSTLAALFVTAPLFGSKTESSSLPSPQVRLEVQPHSVERDRQVHAILESYHPSVYNRRHEGEDSSGA